MKSIVIISGNIGKRRTFKPGDDEKKAFLSFSIAQTHRSASGTTTDWFDVKAFGALAESLEPRLQTGLWLQLCGTLRQQRDGDGKALPGKTQIILNDYPNALIPLDLPPAEAEEQQGQED